MARTLAENGLDHTIWISDLGELERKEQASIALRKAVFKKANNKADHMDLGVYHTYEEVCREL